MSKSRKPNSAKAAAQPARIGDTGLVARYVVTLWASALIAAAAGLGVERMAAGTHRIAMAVLVLGSFGVLYFILTTALGIPESSAVLRRIRRGMR